MEDIAMIAGGVLVLVFALAALTIDFFSKERGVIYQQELNNFQTEKVE